jgi:uncharacterized membrane protein
MKNIKYYSLLFAIGAVGYAFLEVLWRGYTHPSMAVAGGLSFCGLSLIQKYLKPLKFIYRCITGGLVITLIEVIFGAIFNLWLDLGVWDYSSVPLNFFGQICLLFTVMWCFLSAPFLIITDLIREKHFGKQTRYNSRNMSNKTT